MAKHKKYRITYNPYRKDIGLEEHYQDADPDWAVLDGTGDYPELQYCTGEDKVLQLCGYDLLATIDKIVSKGYDAIALDFCGMQTDFEDFQAIFDDYVAKNEETTHLKEIRTPSSYWVEPSEIQKQLEWLSNNAQALFDDTSKLSAILQEVAQSSAEQLNILVAGVQNSGKSTFINALIGYELLPMSMDIETACIYQIVQATDYNLILHSTTETEVTIAFKGNAIQYTLPESDIKKNIDRLVKSKKYEKATDTMARLKLLLQVFNDFCKKEQTEKSCITYDCVTIGLKNLSVLSADYGVKIVDVPGSGGAFYQEEHQELLVNQLAKTKNAMLIYLFSSDSFRHAISRSTLDLLSDSAGSQIDFARSLYLINRADALEDKELNDLAAIIKNDKTFQHKNVLFISASYALDFIFGNKVRQSKRLEFTTNPNEPMEYKALYQNRLLSERANAYYDQYFAEQKSCDGFKYGSDEDCLINTGFPLVKLAIQEYADKTASIHRVLSMSDTLQKMFGLMSLEVQEKEAQQEQEAKDCESAKQALKRHLMNKCGDLCSVECEEAENNKGQTISALQENLKVFLDYAEKKLLECLNENYKSKNPIICEELQKCAESVIKTGQKYYAKQAQNVTEEMFSDYRDELIKAIRATKLSPENEVSIRERIRSYSIQLQSDSFKINLGFWSISKEVGFWKRLLHKKIAYEKVIRRSFGEFWLECIVKTYTEKIVSNYKDMATDLTQFTKDGIESFSLELVEEDKKLEEAKQRLARTIQKRNQLLSICEEAEKLLEGGSAWQKQ